MITALGFVLAGIAAPSRHVRETCVDIVFEAESPVASTADWAVGGRPAADPGASGTYITWQGGNAFRADQAGRGVLTYDVQVSVGGTYELLIKSFHDDHDTTESNDVWASVDGEEWFKAYNNAGPEWSWTTKLATHECEGPKPPPCKAPVYALESGSHTIRISGRSNDFSIDQLKLKCTGRVVSSAGDNHQHSAPAPPAPPALPAAVPTVVMPAGCTHTANADHKGGDLKQIDGTPDSAACAAACLQTPGCKHWTRVMEKKKWADVGKCYIKDASAQFKAAKPGRNNKLETGTCSGAPIAADPPATDSATTSKPASNQPVVEALITDLVEAATEDVDALRDELAAARADANAAVKQRLAVEAENKQLVQRNGELEAVITEIRTLLEF